ncbi:MAG: D-alanyl-D-alanine carboxypeptidase [Marinovum sp.]|nr:D-alanyl-D-alanine carboxypeptidase [Marinovum sp.]MDG2231518.1 D-alanyl-D-alanine carboxypeptidase [Paracoccaceae bacterium]
MLLVINNYCSRFLASIASSLLMLCLLGPASALETRAKTGFIIDYSTGTVLLEKNADQPVPPASMSKLMTLYVAFEFIHSGKLSLTETLRVSQHAANYGGSTMFLDTSDRVKVEDLLRGIIVLSGNDACAVIAEALSPDGTEAGFARIMTERAKQIGLSSSSFKNSNGWPAEGHLMSMRDLALLAGRLISEFPEFYPMFSEVEFEFDGRAPANTRNRNPLLGLGIGADGLKTGHTSEAGYGLVGSAKQGDRRIVFALSGMSSVQERAEEAEAVVNWAFRQFVQKSFGSKGIRIAEVDLWNGADRSVGVVLGNDLKVLVPVLGDEQVSFELEYENPIPAPVKKGQKIAVLKVHPKGLPETEVPLLAEKDVAVGGFFAHLSTAAKTLLNRVGSNSEGAF